MRDRYADDDDDVVATAGTITTRPATATMHSTMGTIAMDAGGESWVQDGVVRGTRRRRRYPPDAWIRSDPSSAP
jgi:hypothetical protein